MLAAESARYGVPPQLSRFPPVLDPYVMNKQVDRYRKGKRTLTALCEEYGVDLTNAHTSAADALATLRVLDAMAGKFPKLQMPAPALHQLQVDWAASQAADFQQYLRRSKPTAVIEASGRSSRPKTQAGAASSPPGEQSNASFCDASHSNFGNPFFRVVRPRIPREPPPPE